MKLEILALKTISAGDKGEGMRAVGVLSVTEEKPISVVTLLGGDFQENPVSRRRVVRAT